LCIAAFGASVRNGLGAYDGIVVAIDHFLIWVLPWLIGRIIYGNSDNALILIRYLIIGAMIYVPFCVFEMKMAPVLHSEIYGYAPRGKESLRGLSLRFGLWRPNVFQEMGIALALFMGGSAVLALWAALTGRFRTIASVPIAAAVTMLAVTTAFCVSAGAMVLTLMGMFITSGAGRPLYRPMVLALSLLSFLYPAYRIANTTGLKVNLSAGNSLLAERQASLQTRIDNEDRFLDHWRSAPLLGHTSRKYQPGGDYAIPDSLWIQILCKFGLVGWLSLTIAMTLPLWTEFRAPQAAMAGRPSTALAICVLMFNLDCQFNAMECPVYVVFAGAATAVALGRHTLPDRKAPKVTQSRERMRRVPWPPLPQVQ
jgi:hypothetical protein